MVNLTMKSVFRFFGIVFAIASLAILTNCNQAPTPDTTSTSPTPTEQSSTAPVSKDQININSAILSELDKLEAQLGVPALSNKIQSSRPYGSTEELVAKNVITQEQFDQIKDQVTVEDIVLIGEARDVDYMTKLGLMKGHMIVAQELIDLGKPDQAEPHVGHPVEEIYVDVEEQFTERQVPQFKTGLISLQDLIKSNPKSPKLTTNFDESMQAIDEAIATLPEEQRQSPRFVLQVINEMLDAANSEYGAAIADNKITAIIEYQDSRGFVTYVDTLLNNNAEAMSKANPEAQKAITESMAKLKTAWPTATAPATPAMPPEQVSQLVKTIEQNAQKIIGG